MAEHNEWGQQAERIASEYLLKNGYIIREQNWRPKNGHVEVDIISQKDNFIIFVEVKARKNSDYDPLDAVTDKKIKKLVRAASAYLNSMEYDFEYRFDVIAVTGKPEDYVLEHIEDAFLPPLSAL